MGSEMCIRDSDYTEKDIVDRKNRIIEGFLHYLEKNELMDK